MLPCPSWNTRTPCDILFPPTRCVAHRILPAWPRCHCLQTSPSSNYPVLLQTAHRGCQPAIAGAAVGSLASSLPPSLRVARAPQCQQLPDGLLAPLLLASGGRFGSLDAALTGHHWLFSGTVGFESRGLSQGSQPGSQEWLSAWACSQWASSILAMPSCGVQH